MQLTTDDPVGWSLVRAFKRLQRLRLRGRGVVFTWWARAWGAHIGRGLCLDRHVRIRHLPGPGWWLGDDIYLGVGAVLDIRRATTFRLGDRVKIMHHVVIGVAEHLEIGADSQVAESSTIRDQDHDVAPGAIMAQTPLITAPVLIGTDVWIARGAAVLRGVTIADHAVVAANSVVRSDVAEHAIVGGVPARQIGSRLDRASHRLNPS